MRRGRPLTLAGFLRKLKAAHKVNPFSLTDSVFFRGQLRSASPVATYGGCPITAVCFNETGKLFKMQDFGMAADEVRLPEALAAEIAAAADTQYGPRARSKPAVIRRQMLRTLGLGK